MPTLEVSDETLAKIKEQLGDELEIKEIESLDDLIGETYLFQCARYIYHGKVKSVTTTYIEIENAGIVFNTGDYSNTSPEDRQALPHNAFVMRQSIEAFYKMKW
jgi:hypothetical protein